MADCNSQTSLSNWTYIKSRFCWALWSSINLCHANKPSQIPPSSRWSELNGKHWPFEAACRLGEESPEEETPPGLCPAHRPRAEGSMEGQRSASRGLVQPHGQRPARDLSGRLNGSLSLAPNSHEGSFLGFSQDWTKAGSNPDTATHSRLLSSLVA